MTAPHLRILKVANVLSRVFADEYEVQQISLVRHLVIHYTELTSNNAFVIYNTTRVALQVRTTISSMFPLSSEIFQKHKSTSGKYI